MKKKVLSLILALLMLISLCPVVFAADDSLVVLGADLTEEQIREVYRIFGIERGSVQELSITNAEERSYLEGLIDESKIGTKSCSSVYLEIRSDNQGMIIETNNISWCTPDMYYNALVTAGITDAKIVVAAPFESTGTSALAGIYKAYESITGSKLDEQAKSAGTQELSITGELAEQFGSLSAIRIIAALKDLVGQSASLSDRELREEIVSIASDCGVTLSEHQITQLVELFRSLEKIDAGSIRERVENAQETIQHLGEAKDKAEGLFEKLGGLMSAISEFISGLKDMFS